jgi:hypothetical protein
MKKNHHLFLCLLLLLFSHISYSTNLVEQNFKKTIATRFYSQWFKSPQEKVYLHTDKPYYSAGEEIWFKAFLVNATTHIPNTLSSFIYVELIDRSDSVLTRIKIRKDSLGFRGSIPLNTELPAGNYTLRAYTYWMQNVSDSFYFHKRIYIGNSIDDRIRCNVTYGLENAGQLPVNLNFTNTFFAPVAGKKVQVINSWNNPNNRRISMITNKDGNVSWQLRLDTLNKVKKYFEASIDEDYLKYKNKFFIPSFRTDFDIQFFPESGVLLNEKPQIVAFKAIGTDGLSVDVTGKIFTNKDEEIASFSSINKGMGKFYIETRAGESFYAIVRSASGVEKRFDFVTPLSSGVSIRLVTSGMNIMYEVENKTDHPNQALYLLVHSRGMLLAIQQLIKNEGHVMEKLLPSGVVSFSVIDSVGNVYCERLTFIPSRNQPVVSMESDKKIYAKRDSVNLQFRIESVLKKEVIGNYSVSITDSRTVKLDSLNDNILSYLLLTSDIKGYIEEPASYFLDGLIPSREKMDLLMLTQGWRRFNTGDLMNGKVKQPDFYLEAGQALSGKVLNIFGKPVRFSDIIMFSPYKSIIRTTQTDSIGNYFIDGIEFPDSTTFILKAKKKKGIADVELVPDSEIFPKPYIFIPELRAEDQIPPNDYFLQSKERYYNEGGMLVIGLDELIVKGNKKQQVNSTDIYSGMASTQLTSEDLDKQPGMNVMDIISTVPGVQVTGSQISIRGSQNNPMFMIDGIETDNIDDLTYLTTNDVEGISIFKGADASIFGSRGGNGVISITLKKGVIVKSVSPLSLANIMPLGYQKPSGFYVPKYEVDSIRMLSIPDLRTTIYWNPNLEVDNTGSVSVNFFTADKPNDYSVVFEGVSNAGEIIRYVGNIRREGF